MIIFDATNAQANMESCLKFIPRKSYPWYGLLSLSIFASIGVVIVGITSDFESKATLQCNPDKTLASDFSTRKYIEAQCFQKYVQEFYPFLPLNVVCIINFGLVLILSIIYAVMVKRRVEIFQEQSRHTANGGQDESQPLTDNMSQAALDRSRYQNANQHFVFTVYVLHLIICRILPLVGFAVLLLSSVKFPTQFHCPWRKNSMSTSNVNVTQTQGRNVSIVDCIYPMGSKNEKGSAIVISINFLFATEALIELAHVLWSAWKYPSIVSDIEFYVVYLSKNRQEIGKVVKKIKQNVSDKVFYLDEDFGEKKFKRRTLDEIYINVIIQEGRESTLTYNSQLKNRHEWYDTHLNKPKYAISLSKASNLFQPMKNSETLPKTILVVGRPGIGKTLLTKKILNEWKNAGKHESNQDIPQDDQKASEFWSDKIVILIQFRDFNDSKTSLRKMLKYAHGLNVSRAEIDSIFEYICLTPEKVVFIFDGLDEIKYDEHLLAAETSLNDPNQEEDILQIFKKMVEGQLLPGVTVLTTSRPTAEHIYTGLSFNQEVEILGFHREEIKSYVKKFCRKDEDKSEKLWKLIEQSPEYLSLSYIPVNCYIICLTLKETIDADESDESGEHSSETNVPRTITELYKRAINILLFRHHNDYRKKKYSKDYMNAKLPEQLQNELDDLKKFARNGMKDDQLVFVLPSGSRSAKLSDCGIINKLQDRRRNLFCFLHLTIQEFLAAQHVVDDMEHVEAFLIDHISDPKWHLVIQFVAGLIGDKIRILERERNDSERFATELTNDERIIKGIYKRFQDWMPKDGEIDGDQKKLLPIKCVHEMQEVGGGEIMTSFVCDDDGQENDTFILSNLSLAPMETAALFEFIGRIMNLQFVQILDCTVEQSAYLGLATLLKKDNKIKDLVIRNCGTLDDDAKDVIDALGNENCKITRLDLTDSKLTDESAKYLKDALKSSKCKLTDLYLKNNELTDAGVMYLSEALMSGECKLTKLFLSRNELSDAGVKYLRDALKSGNCKLTELILNHNKLTDVGVEFLSEALVSGECKLTKLFLRNNDLSDAAAEYLRDSLKSENCKLAELNLNDNELTDAGVEFLSEALMSGECKLTKLFLRNNNLSNAAVECLRDVLKSGNCKLTDLNLKPTSETGASIGYEKETIVLE